MVPFSSAPALYALHRRFPFIFSASLASRHPTCGGGSFVVDCLSVAWKAAGRSLQDATFPPARALPQSCTTGQLASRRCVVAPAPVALEVEHVLVCVCAREVMYANCGFDPCPDRQGNIDRVRKLGVFVSFSSITAFFFFFQWHWMCPALKQHCR